MNLSDAITLFRSRAEGYLGIPCLPAFPPDDSSEVKVPKQYAVTEILSDGSMYANAQPTRSTQNGEITTYLVDPRHCLIRLYAFGEGSIGLLSNFQSYLRGPGLGIFSKTGLAVSEPGGFQDGSFYRDDGVLIEAAAFEVRIHYHVAVTPPSTVGEVRTIPLTLNDIYREVRA